MKKLNLNTHNVTLSKAEAKKECILLPGKHVIQRLAIKQAFTDLNLN